MVSFETRVYFENRTYRPFASAQELDAVVYVCIPGKPLPFRLVGKNFTAIRTFSVDDPVGGTLTSEQFNTRIDIEYNAATKHVEAWLPGTCSSGKLIALTPCLLYTSDAADE